MYEIVIHTQINILKIQRQPANTGVGYQTLLAETYATISV